MNKDDFDKLAKILNEQREQIFIRAALSITNRTGTPAIRPRFDTSTKRDEVAALWNHDITQEHGLRYRQRFGIDECYMTWKHGSEALVIMKELYPRMSARHQRDIDEVLASYPHGTRPRGRPRAWTL